jgi:hypothetical protein
VALAAALVSAASLLALPWARPGLYAAEEAQGLAKRAVVCYHLGRLAEARELLRRALARDARMVSPEQRELARQLLENPPRRP